MRFELPLQQPDLQQIDPYLHSVFVLVQPPADAEKLVAAINYDAINYPFFFFFNHYKDVITFPFVYLKMFCFQMFGAREPSKSNHHHLVYYLPFDATRHSWTVDTTQDDKIKKYEIVIVSQKKKNLYHIHNVCR